MAGGHFYHNVFHFPYVHVTQVWQEPLQVSAGLFLERQVRRQVSAGLFLERQVRRQVSAGLFLERQVRLARPSRDLIIL